MSKAFQIKDSPEYYVTDSGEMYSRKEYHNPQGRIKKITPQNRKGYKFIRLYKNNKASAKCIHRLVAEAFIPNPENKPYVNHKNGIKTDNRVESLEWVSASANTIHAHRVLGRKSSLFGRFGKDNPKSKRILQIKDNKIIAEFYGCYEACRVTGINHGHISACCRGERKTAGGFQWQYK